MALFSKILVPVEFSPRCRGSAQYAEALACRFHCEIVFLHVVHPEFTPYTAPEVMAYASTIEINEELARVAKMNMIIHDDGHTNIVGHDALDFLNKIAAQKSTLLPGRFDLVLTNPPFGSVVKRAEKGEGYLEQFDLRNYIGKITTETEPDGSTAGETDAKRGAKAVKDRVSIKTEILFLERVHSFLKYRPRRHRPSRRNSY